MTTTDLGVLTLDQLEEVVNGYFEFDEFVVDVETRGEYRGDPHRNEVFWISLAGPGRADAIPCGHPLGERIPLDPDDDTRRINPNSGKHEEHRLNPDTGRIKWFEIPEPFTPAPKQLWISDVIEQLRPLFFSGRRIIGHNVKFDLESLSKYFGAVPPGPYGDTFVAARLVNENEKPRTGTSGPFSLGACVDREFGYLYEKIGRKGPEKFPYSEAYQYSYLDAKYTWLLWRVLKDRLDQENVRHIFDMEMDLLPVLIKMERRGITIDEKSLRALGDEFEFEMAKIQVALEKVAGCELNLNANRQVAHLVYDILEHPCTLLTKSGERSTARDTLEKFAKDEHVAQLLDHAALRKLKGAFVDGLQKTIVERTIHPDFNQVGAVSGRLSCRSPNIQQIPSRSERGKRIRDIFVARPGYVLIVADLSQIELRVLAHFTRDRNLRRAYREGLDLHSLTARVAFGPNFTPIQRSLAKNGNFSVLYGAGPGTMVRRYGFPNVDLARQVIESFYEAYPRVKPWKKDVLETARRLRRQNQKPYVVTILGRKRRLPELVFADRERRSPAERQAISVTISGTAADYFKLAMIQCQEMLDAAPWDAHILMTVHDELVVEVPAEEGVPEEALELVKASMEQVNHPETGEPLLSVPVVADGKIVERWSEAK